MKKKILIVDDEKDTCSILEKALAKEGYRAFSALSGQSALDKLKKMRPDLVLLDIRMPKMDGIEVLKRIKRIDKSIAVVMITAYGALDTVQWAKKYRAYDYVSKPFDMDFIKAVIREALLKKKPRASFRRRRGINK